MTIHNKFFLNETKLSQKAFKIWSEIRVLFRLKQSSNTIPKIYNITVIKNYIFNFFINMKNSILLSSDKVDITFFSGNRKIRIENEFINIYIDNLIPLFSTLYTIKSIENPDRLGINYKSKYHRFTVYTDILYPLTFFSLIVSPLFIIINANSIIEIIKIMNISFYAILKKFSFFHSINFFSLILFKYYLSKSKSRVAIITCYYGLFKQPFIKAAKLLNIPVIELQHGTMGKYHIAYNFAEKGEYDFFPDYVFVWGQYWKDTTRFPIPDERVIVTGFPYFEERINELKKKENLSQKKVILFISQWTIDEELSKIAVDLSNLN
jgi:hypothetical protein